MEVELDKVLERGLHSVFVALLFEITQAAGVIDGFHLRFGVNALLRLQQRGIADVRGDDFDFPRRRDQRLGRRHLQRKRIAQVVVGQRIANLDGHGVRFLAGGAASAPETQREIATLLLAAQKIFEHDFGKKLELRQIAEETGFVNGEILEKRGQFLFPFMASKKSVVAVERVQIASFEASLEAVAEKMDAMLVEAHAAFLIDESLQELELRLGEGYGNSQRGHGFSRMQTGSAGMEAAIRQSSPQVMRQSPESYLDY